jgi:peptide methionine sulfoxide reductase MsrB
MNGKTEIACRWCGALFGLDEPHECTVRYCVDHVLTTVTIRIEAHVLDQVENEPETPDA